MTLRAAFLALLATLLLAAGASAATVTVTSVPDYGRYGGGGIDVGVKGGAGRDEITATGDVRGVTVVDATDTLTTDGNPFCGSVDAHQVRCGRSTWLDLDGGDGDDAVALAGVFDGTVGLSGDGGDDTLTAGPTAAALSGGPGDDTLTGGEGHDHLVGGPGADVVTAGAGDDTIGEDGGDPASVDRLDGGAGTDQLDVSGAKRMRTTADLAAGTLTGASTASFTGIEDADGDAVHDGVVLLGDDGPNRLYDGGLMDGRGGDDTIYTYQSSGRIVGGPGDDTLTGRDGTVLDGGPGDDTLEADIGPLGAVACGDGDDQVSGMFGSTLIPIDCEHTVILLGPVGHPLLGRSTLTVALSGRLGQAGCGVLVQAQTLARRPLTQTMRVSRAAYRAGLGLALPLTRAGRHARAAGTLRVVRLFVASAVRCPRAHHRAWTRSPGSRTLRASS